MSTLELAKILVDLTHYVRLEAFGEKSNPSKENSLQPKAIIQEGACVDSQITQEPKGQGDRTLKSLVQTPIQNSRSTALKHLRTLHNRDIIADRLDARRREERP